VKPDIVRFLRERGIRYTKTAHAVKKGRAIRPAS
jgi:hypothetical protein